MTTSTNLEIKVDVIGQMRNTVKTFADRLCFVDELVQNAQRAGASRVDFRFGETSLRYQDNGPGCDDLSKVFTQSLSGWSTDVQKSDDPFGFGFFSCIVVADTIIVESHSRAARFDVAQMFRENRTDVITTGPSNLNKGFSVLLQDLKDLDLSEVQKRVRQVAKYVDVKVYLDGDLCRKQSMVQKTYQEECNSFSRVCKNSVFNGVLYPTGYGEISSYYQGREVCDIWVDGIGGRIEVKPGQADPRCPDRKAWIENRKLWALRRKLQEYAKKVMMDVVRYGSDEEISQLSNAIDRLLGGKAHRYLKFDVRADETLPVAVEETGALLDETPIEDVEVEYTPVEKPDTTIEDTPTPPPVLDAVTQDAIRLVKKADASVRVSAAEWTKAAASPETTEGIVAYEDPEDDDLVIVAKETNKRFKPQRQERQGTSLADLKFEPVLFWLMTDDVADYTNQIAEAKYCGAKVVFCQTELHRKAVQTLKNTRHIAELKGGMSHSVDLLARGPRSAAEFRAEKLLTTMAAIFGKVEVEVADVTFYNEFTVNGKSTGKLAEATSTLAAAKGRWIVFQRAALPTDILEGVALDAPIGGQDRAFMMRVLATMSHELVHVIADLNDGDSNFYEWHLSIQDKIVASVFSRESLVAKPVATKVERVVVNVPRYPDGQLALFEDLGGLGK